MNRGTKTMSASATDKMENSVRQWIETVLTQPQDNLNGLSACPYALSAMLNNQLYFWNGNAQQPGNSLEEMAICLPGWDPIIMAVTYFVEWKSTQTPLEVVEYFNSYHRDLVAFALDPEDWHEFAGVKILTPPCTILTVQWKEHIDTARPELWMAGYYRNFTEQDLEAIEYLTGSNTKTK